MVNVGLVVALVIALALPEDSGEDGAEDELVEIEFRRGRRGKGENRAKMFTRVSEIGVSS